MEETEKVWGLLKENAFVRKLVVDDQEKTLAQRREAKAKLDRSQAEQEVVIPKLRAEVASADEELKKLEEARTAAVERRQAARAILYENQGRLARGIQVQEAILAETAPAAVREAIDFFQTRLDELRVPGRLRAWTQSQVRPLTGERTFLLNSNADSITAAITLCQEAIREVEAMRQDAEPDLDRIRVLRASIPDSDNFVRTETRIAI